MPQTQTQTIFLADDDADDCLFFEDALKEVSTPTQLTISQDGVVLMTSLDEMAIGPPPPHVIFLDLNMPRKNGFECLQEIRETPKLKKIPVVIFSTTSNEKEIDRTYSLGADYYVCKPSSHEMLIKTIEKVLALNIGEHTPQRPKEKFVLCVS